MKRVGRFHFLSVIFLVMYIGSYTFTSQAQELSGTETYDFKMSKGISNSAGAAMRRRQNCFSKP